MTLASLAGILVFVAGVPAVAAALFAFPQHRRWWLAAMVFTTCYIKKPFYQEVFFADYRGVDRGFGVTVPDLIFCGFLLWMACGGLRRRVQWVPFNSWPWFLVIAVSALSLVGSIEPLYGWFTIHKFVRCWILYVVVVNLVRDREDVAVVLSAMAAALLFQGVVVFWDRYVTRAVLSRAVGTFRHPNTLAMYTELMAPALLAALMTGLLSPRRRMLFGAALFAGFVAVLLTKSRAAMFLLPASLGVVVAVSILVKPTMRKFGIMALGAMAAGLVVAMILPQLVRRFETAPKESAETREYFNIAAEAMARENLLGVGVNLYSHALAMTDYYWYVYPDFVDTRDPEAFRMTVRGQSRLGTAHHIYWLVAAETGWIGLGAFLLHIGLFWLHSLWAFLRERDHLFKSIFLGFVVGAGVLHVHGLLEWILRQTEVLYLFFIANGLMVAMVRIRRGEKAALARRRKAAARPPRPARAARVSVGAVQGLEEEQGSDGARP